MKCNTCGEEFDPANLSSVFLHEHDEDLNPSIAIGIKGVEVKKGRQKTEIMDLNKEAELLNAESEILLSEVLDENYNINEKYHISPTLRERISVHITRLRKLTDDPKFTKDENFKGDKTSYFTDNK